MNNTYQEFKSKQNSVHPELIDLVTKYARTTFLRPVPEHQRRVFDELLTFARNFDELIIDSGCGTGLSTMKLAEQFSNHGVIGIDKSLARLGRAASFDAPNYLLLRADVIDLWRLLREAKLPIARHYVLYPNPWPKISHLKRRFHGHPIFKTMIDLAPYFELRTNWQIYADECATAIRALGQTATVSEKQDKEYLSLFEKKYLLAHCPLYIVRKGNEKNDLSQNLINVSSSFKD